MLDRCRILAALYGASLFSVHGESLAAAAEARRLRRDGGDGPSGADTELVGERSHDLRIKLRA